MPSRKFRREGMFVPKTADIWLVSEYMMLTCGILAISSSIIDIICEDLRQLGESTRVICWIQSRNERETAWDIALIRTSWWAYSAVQAIESLTSQQAGVGPDLRCLKLVVVVYLCVTMELTIHMKDFGKLESGNVQASLRYYQCPCSFCCSLDSLSYTWYGCGRRAILF